ncbi:MAG: NUDIX hydrolase [Eubacteriales bacterium]
MEHTPTYDQLFEETLDKTTIFEGHVVHLQKDSVRLINGKTVTREVVRHNGGVAVLALNEANEVYFVSQYRYPLAKVLTELPAGKLDGAIGSKEEDHLAAAKRELQEETGLVATHYHSLGAIYPTPGFCDEVLHMYLATGLSQHESNPDDDEFLNVIKVPFETALAQVMSGELQDGKTVAAILKAKIFLDQQK